MRYGFFLGPDKAGSSWLHEAIRRHPQVSTPGAKDLFYFDRYYHRGNAWYERHFPDRREVSIRVEVCHDYLFSELAAKRIAVFAPDANLIVCLRHPVGRAVSSYLYMIRQGRLSEVSFSQALRSVDELIEHGRYGQWLAPYLDRFPLNQLLVLDFDALVSDPVGTAESVYRHLGVDPAVSTRETMSVVRPASRARSSTLATSAKRAASLARRLRLERVLGTAKRSALVERLLFRPLEDVDRPVVTNDDRDFIREALLDDTRLLDDRLGSSWASAWWDST